MCYSTYLWYSLFSDSAILDIEKSWGYFQKIIHKKYLKTKRVTKIYLPRLCLCLQKQSETRQVWWGYCSKTGSQASAWKATKGSLLQRDRHISELIPSLAFDRLACQCLLQCELLCADFSMASLKLGHDFTFHYWLNSSKS